MTSVTGLRQTQSQRRSSGAGRGEAAVPMLELKQLPRAH